MVCPFYKTAMYDRRADTIRPYGWCDAGTLFAKQSFFAIYISKNLRKAVGSA